MDALDRLYRRLVDVLRREHPASLNRPIAIAEIYQHLVPYRAVRADLGFAELAEYEHTLLRLLAGERDYARVDLPQVREEFQRELRAASPLLGLYRDYAAVGVQLNLEALPAASPAPPARPAAPPSAAPPVEASPSPPAAAAPARAVAAPPAEGALVMPRQCRSCREPLPHMREVRFCPSCGESQQMAPCRACGTALEQEWKFCIRCGYPRRPTGGSR